MSANMNGARKVNPKLAVMAVMKTMSMHISRGEITKIKGSLPAHIRALWDEAEQMEASKSAGGRRVQTAMVSATLADKGFTTPALTEFVGP